MTRQSRGRGRTRTSAVEAPLPRHRGGGGGPGHDHSGRRGNEQGKVVDIKLLRGIPILDVAAVEAVKRWRYAPTLVEGVPKRVVVTEVLDLFENENSRDSFYLKMLKDRKGDVKWRLHALERLRSVPGKEGPKFRSTFAKLVNEDPDETIRVAAEAALR